MTYEEKRNSTKPATHAGYLNSLVCQVQKHPEDKDALSALIYEVHDDAALEMYPGNFAEGYTVNESWTAEDTAKVIESAQRIAAEPLSNCVWPDDSDHTIEAAALRAQTRRLAGLPEEMIEELAWQHEHPEPKPDWWLAIEAADEADAQEPAATEPEPGPAALVFNSLAEYKTWAAGASTQERHAYWDALSDFDWQCLWDDLEDEAAAQEPAPLDYLDTEGPDDWEAQHEERLKWLHSMDIVADYYAVGWPFYDHEQVARLTVACSDDELLEMEQILYTETKAEREVRLIAVKAPCSAGLIELQALRQTATSMEALEMENRLCDTYGCWLEPRRERIPRNSGEAVKQALTKKKNRREGGRKGQKE